MGPRSALGSAPFNVAMWLAVVLLAVGAAMAGNDVLAAPRLPASASEVPIQFEAQPPCLVLLIDLTGRCPLPAIPATPFTRRATIFLCAESLCGSGFRADDVILLLARTDAGSRLWRDDFIMPLARTADGSPFRRTRADRGGNFRSPLPSPLCHFTPVSLTALGDHTGQSTRLSLASTRCASFKN